ncbi:venom phosphodiesterase 2 isoform X1 [Callorhinchus milii]|uniref:Venom phosphodiesterase 2-like n=1 Tax=Callorhinchus milii TaxID=7868 RepID=A0A4W3I5L9_CALMI|nr:venom phosphodiesterase 2 isoform X1 [Callorhinchus milii]|eukprot:gi/632962622/ref/XP_007897424.1/ PREDICTED: venom phosphodiesterase 2-like isoform X1 [Callorhinchus milii]
MDPEGDGAASRGYRARYSNEEQRAVMLPSAPESGGTGRGSGSGSGSRRGTRRVIVGVVLLCMLIILLGLGLGFGLRSCAPKTAQLWRCTNMTCGEKSSSKSLCSCSNNCIQEKNCCTNYKSICRGENTWLQDTHENIDKPECPEGFNRSPVILVSLDGFRADYLHKWRNVMPVLDKLSNCGTYASHLIPVYPTKTFPNHYSIITGLYPESHGLIDNKMYDVQMNANFSLRKKEKFNPAWYKGEPLWLTAMYQGLKSGIFFWPGSEVAINGTYPNFYKIYKRSITFEKRIFEILQWLDLPIKDRPDLYTLYFEEPDSTGHQFGPNSNEVGKKLKMVDEMLGMLMDGLKQRNLHRCVNLIVLSDHGMEEFSFSRIEYMSNYVDNVDDFYMGSGPAPRIRPSNVPKDYFTFDAEGLVRKLTCRLPGQHFKPYLKRFLPKRFHYANSLRIEEVNLYLDPQWQAGLKHGSIKYLTGGFHGSDNRYKNMRALFIAYGPGFKDNTEVQPFANIEIYNLMCDLLEITPAPNNGSHGSLNHLLKKPIFNPTHAKERSSPTSCPFTKLAPNDSLECSCSLPASLSRIVKKLNLSSTEVQNANAQHVPYGRPRVLQDGSKYCLLHQHMYISGYSHDILMPLWTAYTINQMDKPTANLSNCLFADVRISLNSSQKCSYYKKDHNISYGFLYPLNLQDQHDKYEGLLTSNIVPMHKAFQKVWNYFHNVLLVKYAIRRNGINVISGPVFDYDFDGHFDTPDKILEYLQDIKVPIPTHYYIILTSCTNTSQTPTQCKDSLRVLSFILPHRTDNSESCADGKEESQWVEERVWMHTARVRDVELITGLDFYQDRKQPVTEILQLKTFLPPLEDKM